MQAENSKSEYLNPKQIQIIQILMTKTENCSICTIAFGTLEH